MIRITITAAIAQPEVRRCGAAAAACGAGAPDEAPELRGAPGLDGAGLLPPAGDPAPGMAGAEPGPLASNRLANPPPAGAPLAEPLGPGRSGGSGTGVRNSSGSRPDGVLDGAVG